MGVSPATAGLTVAALFRLPLVRVRGGGDLTTGGAQSSGGLRGLVVKGGQQFVEVLTARAARAQVRRDAWVPLLHRTAGGGQFGVDVQHVHRFGASHVTRIGPQEAVQFRSARS